MAKNRENGAEGAVLAKFWAFLPNGQPKFFPDNHIWVAGCPADNQQIFLISRPDVEPFSGVQNRIYRIIRARIVRDGAK